MFLLPEIWALQPMVHKLKLDVDVASLVTVTKTVRLTSSVPAVRVSNFPITAASRFTEEREILKISTLEKLLFTDASKEFKQQQGTPPKSDISYSQAATRAAQPIQCSSFFSGGKVATLVHSWVHWSNNQLPLLNHD